MSASKRSVSGYGNGKIILVGEHAVVYGAPAMAMALQRRVVVNLTETNGLTRTTERVIQDPRLQRMISEFLPPEGLLIDVESDIPAGRGLGSSSALAVALVRAKASLQDKSLNPSEVFSQAFEIERLFHGNPSGIDHAVAAQQGLLLYRRGPPPILEPLPSPSWSIVVIDSGTPGDTRAMVEGVASRRPKVDFALASIGDLVERLQPVFDDPVDVGRLFLENHRLLQEIGVSTPRLDTLVKMAIAEGAFGAKLSGAGGGGVVIAVTTSPDELVKRLGQKGISAWVAIPSLSLDS